MNGDSERGSATVLVLALVAVGAVLLMGLGLLIGAQVSRSAAQSAADLAALAAAHSVQDGFFTDAGFSGAPAPGSDGLPADGSAPVGSAPCAVASVVVERNLAEVESCSVGPGGVVDVVATRTASVGRIRVGQASATARAGPVWMRDLLASP